MKARTEGSSNETACLEEFGFRCSHAELEEDLCHSGGGRAAKLLGRLSRMQPSCQEKQIMDLRQVRRYPNTCRTEIWLMQPRSGKNPAGFSRLCSSQAPAARRKIMPAAGWVYPVAPLTLILFFLNLETVKHLSCFLFLIARRSGTTWITWFPPCSASFAHIISLDHWVDHFYSASRMP